MKKSAFFATCIRGYGTPERAMSELGLNPAEFSALTDGEGSLPLSVSRAMRYAKPIPRDGKGGFPYIPGPNQSCRVQTPDGVFDNVHAAAERHGINQQAAYRRAARGAKGWSLLPMAEKERKQFWDERRETARKAKNASRRKKG